MKFIGSISFLLIILVGYTYEDESDPYEDREHSLTRPYPSVFSTSNSYWHLHGFSLATDRYIRLTSDTQSKYGGLWNMIPVTYADWEMHVHFHVHGEGKGFFGDGFAIWYARDPKLDGPVFGYTDYFYGLAVIMDTYANDHERQKHIYPYISAIVNNGTLHYNHDRDGTDISIAGCESSFRGRTTDTLVAIRYENNRLTVSTDVDGKNIWVVCFSIDNIHLPTNYYFGFTAATGQLSDNHDIISVRTFQLATSEQRRSEDRKNIIPAAPAAKPGSTENDTSKSSSWSVLKIFLLVVFVILICLGAIGSVWYMRSYSHRSKRFY
ncbi:unnamed protein product [Adineta ricciae]|uniref:L-type lectin-like domain-containing protein n=1 Tax=Adineta ricciae TaxID=249248 RepID=A0A813VNH0_ADIRI|nr:unnamed protein product [Adineta ricciae]CAF0844210.1 unnamed protein product [Adineta ricciae]